MIGFEMLRTKVERKKSLSISKHIMSLDSLMMLMDSITHMLKKIIENQTRGVGTLADSLLQSVLYFLWHAIGQDITEFKEVLDHQILQIVLKCACRFRISEVKARMALAGLLYNLTGYIESMVRLDE